MDIALLVKILAPCLPFLMGLGQKAVEKGAERMGEMGAEGMLPQFVETDPWFAGWSAVMVNVSDIYAMGGANDRHKFPLLLALLATTSPASYPVEQYCRGPP